MWPAEKDAESQYHGARDGFANNEPFPVSGELQVEETLVKSKDGGWGSFELTHAADCTKLTVICPHPGCPVL